MSALPLAVSVGDPAGVGPIVALRAGAQIVAQVPLVLFGDAEQLRALADAERIATREIANLAESQNARSHEAPCIQLFDTGRVDERVIALRAPSAEGGLAQLTALRKAAEAVQMGQARALVTGPTSKAAIVRAGHPFVGQTEFLAKLADLADDAVSMLFLGPRLRVGLVTTHLALSDVPGAITAPRLERTVRHMAEVLMRLYPEQDTRLLSVVGLNPHAGEGGLFGREEIDVMEPALARLRAEPLFADGRVQLFGPSPAESVFRAAQRGDIHGVVAMFHDQATLASKLLDWGAAVNTTWGLPFLRTSVDHGVAYDAVVADKVEAEGMLAAMQMAVRLTRGVDVL